MLTASVSATTEPLSATDSSGRQISLLNNEPHSSLHTDPGFQEQPRLLHRSSIDDNSQYQAAMFDVSRPPVPLPPGQVVTRSTQQNSWDLYPGSSEPNSNNFGSPTKRKYHCTEPGCNKSFTTSGHLARHNRIHTGEKNFPCLFPGCQSRFSRQDNMMQHYRTHMSPKSRRPHKRLSNGNTTDSSRNNNSNIAVAAPEEGRPRPRLHAHHRIFSGPLGAEQPLTIDQHLSIYRRSLISPALTTTTIAAASKSFSPGFSNNEISSFSTRTKSMSASSTVSRATTDLPPIQQMTSSDPSSIHSAAAAEEEAIDMFYQHRPLTFSADAIANITGAPSLTTLLGPSIGETQLLPAIAEYQNRNDQQQREQQDDWSPSSSDGLLQLAHVVSTFG